MAEPSLFSVDPAINRNRENYGPESYKCDCYDNLEYEVFSLPTLNSGVFL